MVLNLVEYTCDLCGLKLVTDERNAAVDKNGKGWLFINVGKARSNVKHICADCRNVLYYAMLPEPRN